MGGARGQTGGEWGRGGQRGGEAKAVQERAGRSGRAGERECGSALVDVASEDADDDALDFDSVGGDDSGLHGVIGGLEADVGAFFVEALEGGFAGVEEGDDLLAVAGGFAALDDDVVAVAEVVFDHGLAADAEDVDALLGGEHLLEVELLAVFDGFDGGAGCDVAEEGELGGALFVWEGVGDDFE